MAKDDSGEKPKRGQRKKIAIQYPKHAFRPEDLLDFLELPQFTKRWEKLGLSDKDDLAILQMFIMLDPKGAAVIKGTKGLRKGRFVPKGWPTGQSGGVRVLYVHFGFVLLCLVYAKNEVSTISDAVKKYLNKKIEEAEIELKARFSD